MAVLRLELPELAKKVVEFEPSGVFRSKLPDLATTAVEVEAIVSKDPEVSCNLEDIFVDPEFVSMKRQTMPKVSRG